MKKKETKITSVAAQMKDNKARMKKPIVETTVDNILNSIKKREKDEGIVVKKKVKSHRKSSGA